MATSPCIADTDCISLEVLDGDLQAALIISDEGCNSASCVADGLYVPHAKSVAQAGTLPDATLFSGWTVNLDDLTPNVPAIVPNGSTGPEVFTNPSSCLIANYLMAVTSREIEYAGVAGAWFTVEVNNNGTPMFNIMCDYRAYVPATVFQDRRAGGGASGAGVLTAGASFNYNFDIEITRLNVADVGGVITSPGLTWGILAATNQA